MFRAHDSLSSSLASSASIARRGGGSAVIATPVSLLTRRLVRIARWGFCVMAHFPSQA